MRKHIIYLALFLAFPALARAELRTIALDVHQTKDKTVKVSMYSDVKEERQKDLSVAEATKILKKAKGWGSSVEVAVVTRAGDLSAYLPLLQAISDNIWLDLVILKRKDGLGERILKHYGIEQ